MSPDEKLKQLIIEITGAIINDSLTFTKIRLHHNAFYKSLGTGGGNFLMALGLLSVFGFISKLYSILSEPDRIFLQDKYQELKDFKTELSNIPNINKKLLDKLIIPRVGTINEEDAFLNLVKKVQSENILYLGLDGESAKKVWKIYRNKLAHINTPLAPIGVYDQDLSNLTWIEVEHLISKQGSFLVKDDLILCNSDKLVQDSRKLATWLCSYIDTCKKNSVMQALKWLNAQLTI